MNLYLHFSGQRSASQLKKPPRDYSGEQARGGEDNKRERKSVSGFQSYPMRFDYSIISFWRSSAFFAFCKICNNSPSAANSISSYKIPICICIFAFGIPFHHKIAISSFYPLIAIYHQPQSAFST